MEQEMSEFILSDSLDNRIKNILIHNFYSDIETGMFILSIKKREENIISSAHPTIQFIMIKFCYANASIIIDFNNSMI